MAVFLTDDFTTLDTGEWTISTKGAGSGVAIASGKLACTLASAAVANARVRSATEVPTTGVLTITVKWTPGRLGGNGYGTPYIAVVSGSASRDSNYENPTSTALLKLGAQANTTSRSILSCGVCGGTMTIVGGGSTSGTWSENTEYTLVWEIDWDSSTMSLSVDGSELITDQPFTLTPSGTHYLELASCDYGAATNPVEKFDDLSVDSTAVVDTDAEADDAASFTDTVAAALTLLGALADTSAFTDTATCEIVSETQAACVETVALTSELLPITLTSALNELLTTADSAEYEVVLSLIFEISEGIALSSTVSAEATYALVSQFVASMVTAAQVLTTAAASETITCSTLIRLLVALRASIGSTWSDESTVVVDRVAVLREALVLAGNASTQTSTQAALSDSLIITDTLQPLLQLFLSETLVLDDQAAASFARVAHALDTLRLQPSTTATAALLAALEDAIGVSDSLALVVAVVADDSALTLLDQASPAVQRVAAIVEAVRLTGVAGGQVTTAVGAVDGVVLLDRLRALFAAVANDTTVISDTAALAALRQALSAEQVQLVAGTGATLTLAAELLETLSLEGLTALFQQVSAEESVALADTLTAACLAQAVAPEVLSLSTGAEPRFVFVGRADESVVVADSLAVQLKVWLALADGIAFVGRLPLEDGEYQAWVLNTDSLGATQYTNFPFDGLASHGGRSFGLTATGLYELTGDDDAGAPIEALVRTGMDDFGSSYRKALPRAYLYLAQDGGAYLRVTSEWAGQRRQVWYTVTGRASADAAQRRVKLARGVRGTAWQFEIANIDGGALDLRGAEVVPMVLSKRW